MELGLERMRAALGQENKPDFPVIQVLGTNGKGSTSAFLASLACAHGLKCGLYLSPHFLSIRERIIINGQLAPEEDWLGAANAIRAGAGGDDLTYFEFLTLLAVRLFHDSGVDLAIFEAGLGGRNDATSALPAIAHCFTPVAMDHAAIIGPTLAKIAADKADAVRPGTAVFSAPQFPEVDRILAGRCRARGTRLFPVAPLPGFSSLKPRLAGPSQDVNAGLAARAWDWFAARRQLDADPARVAAGLRAAFLPGRFQHAPDIPGLPPMIIDGGHNPHAIQNLLRGLGHAPQTIIYSALADKDWRACLGMLISFAPDATIYLPQLDNPRAEPAEEMAAFANAIRPGQAVPLAGETALAQALDAASGQTLLCGSLYLLAAFFDLYPRFLNQFSTRK